MTVLEVQGYGHCVTPNTGSLGPNYPQTSHLIKMNVKLIKQLGLSLRVLEEATTAPCLLWKLID